ncbi:class I SAM-dependent methyltransferase [Candidatus Woesearchaeota archaeon]|nr:class I SAM-dependent methyltransferase [Candidatus Woesearchaeota archaeon]
MNEHYYTEEPTSKLVTEQITFRINETELKLTTASGVFSRKKIDLGTKILIENIEIKKNTKVLDLGCGYGIIGISIAKIIPDTKVVLTDANKRATQLAKQNAKQNNVTVDVRTGNSYETVAGETFDYILLNPPQTAGRKICFQLIEHAPQHLNKQGVFYLVARHKKGGAVLEAKMKETFGNAETVARESGFRVYKSTKQKD